MPERRQHARFRATVHYDGSGFHGWQSQPEERTVQDAIEEALGRLLDRPVRIHAAGRTDAGVHAAGQEIAFDAPGSWAPGDLRRGLNALVPDDVWVEKLGRAGDEFHPRFGATGRRYEYLLGTREDAASPLRRGRVWPLCREVDREAMEPATRAIIGERSFRAFAKAGQPERGTRCRVEEARWSRTAAGDLVFLVVADRFLHHMVRYLVSCLVDVGTGRRAPEEVSRLLADDPGVRPPTPAPACGLYLTGVRYPEGWNRPAGIPGVRAVSGEDGAAEEGAADRSEASRRRAAPETSSRAERVDRDR